MLVCFDLCNDIDVNSYNGEICYAVIENGQLAFYKTDLEFNETVMLAKFDVDAAEAYREASRSTLIVSDSYLVFFNSKEYIIVSFYIFSGGCNNPCFLSVYRLKGAGFPGNALEETINTDQRGLKDEDQS